MYKKRMSSIELSMTFNIGKDIHNKQITCQNASIFLALTHLCPGGNSLSVKLWWPFTLSGWAKRIWVPYNFLRKILFTKTHFLGINFGHYVQSGTICYYTPWRVVSHLSPKTPGWRPSGHGGWAGVAGGKCDTTRQGVLWRFYLIPDPFTWVPNYKSNDPLTRGLRLSKSYDEPGNVTGPSRLIINMD